MSEKPRDVSEQKRVRDGMGFFRTFLKNPTSVGAVLPSSRYLARALVGRLDALLPGEVVVEYGPGTGPMTAAIRDALPQGVHYLGIELDAGFHELLTKRFPTMAFHRGSAAHVIDILKERGLPRPSRILSGLPFASLPAPVRAEVVGGIVEALHESNGEFRTFQYMHAYGMKSARAFRETMGSHFRGFERIGPIVRNVPPAFVLRYWHAN